MAKQTDFKKTLAQLDKDFTRHQRAGTIPPVDTTLKARLSQISQDLKAQSRVLVSTIIKLKAYYDAGNMISLKNDAIQDDIDDAVTLLDETKEQVEIIDKILNAWR